MKVLLTADIHMTLNPKDEYRWGLWEFLDDHVERTGAQAVFIAGDLTLDKDQHPSQLVNRIASSVRRLARNVDIYIIPGNHDYIDPLTPFFKFLHGTGGVRFFAEPRLIKDGFDGASVLFLPCAKAPGWSAKQLKAADYIIAHQTFAGAKAENGALMSGVSLDVLEPVVGQVWSGDVHVPQKVGKVNYIGAPYHERFGDSFEPRIVLLDLATGKSTSISTRGQFPARHKFQGSPEDFGAWVASKAVKAGDQAKLVIELPASDRPDWSDIRAAVLASAAEYDLDVCGISLAAPLVKERTRGLSRRRVISFSKLVEDYAKANDLDAELGLRYLDG